MTIKLVVTMTREYPKNFSLTDYYGCDTVEDAAKLDKEYIDNGNISFDEFAEMEGVDVQVHVTREDKVVVA